MSACSRHRLLISASLSRTHRPKELLFFSKRNVHRHFTLDAAWLQDIDFHVLSWRRMMQPATRVQCCKPEQTNEFTSVFLPKRLSLFCLSVSSFFTSTSWSFSQSLSLYLGPSFSLSLSVSLPLSLSEAKRRRLVDYSNRLLFHLRRDYNGNLSEVRGWRSGDGGWWLIKA